MKYKDEKKRAKDFIEYIFNWVAHEYITQGHNGFRYTLTDNRLSYIVADKGIDKRLEKLFLKKLSINTKVTYELEPSVNKYADGILKIKIV